MMLILINLRTIHYLLTVLTNQPVIIILKIKNQNHKKK
jgi:hypothetical protein